MQANGRAHRDHTVAGMVALDCFYPLARDHLQFKELWEPDKYRSTLDKYPDTAGIDRPLLGWKVKEAYLFATEKLGNGPPPRYETVFVPLTESDLEVKARSLAQHVSQTGGASWESLLPGIKAPAAILGAASDPQPVPYAEWFTRVVNMS